MGNVFQGLLDGSVYLRLKKVFEKSLKDKDELFTHANHL